MDQDRYPWIAMGVVLGGSYLFVLDTTVLGVALPDISSDFSAGTGIEWIITAYLMAVGAVQPASGWMADRFGRKNTYLAALFMFTVGSVLAGLAPSMEMLILARVVQGFGGGAMQPIGMALIYELFPPDRRGSAMGIWGVAIMAAPAVGPPLGGWVTTAISWRWIFLINLPIGMIVLLLGWRLLRDDGRRVPTLLHWPSWILAATSVVALVVASRQVAEWGPLDTGTLLLFIMSAGLMISLIRISLRRPDPMLEFRIFRTPAFSIATFLTTLLTIVQFGRLTFLPVELQFVRGMDASEVGLLLFPAAFSVAATMALGGWLTDRIGPRIPITLGMAVITGTSFMLGRLTPETTEVQIISILVVGGLGTGLAITPNLVAAMNSLPSRFVSQAAAMRSVNRQVAGAIGTAAFAGLLVSSIGAVSPAGLDVVPDTLTLQAAYNEVFMVSAVITGVGAVLALFLPGRAETRIHQAARAAEAEAEAGERSGRADRMDDYAPL